VVRKDGKEDKYRTLRLLSMPANRGHLSVKYRDKIKIVKLL
jgi:hypothetical protein